MARPTHHVVSLRNPLDVARSLETRDGIPRSRGLELWSRYVEAGIDATEGLPRLVVSYEDLMQDWRPVLGVVARFLRVPGWNEEQEGELDAFLVPELHHQRTPAEDVLDSPELPDRARDLYRRLLTRGAPAPDRGSIPGVTRRRSGDASRSPRR